MPVVMPVEDIKNSAQELMKKFIEEHFSNLQADIVSSIVAGRPFLEIIRYARDKKIDLIVIATHGRDHLLKSSVAEKVARRARCPVLTVRVPLS